MNMQCELGKWSFKSKRQAIYHEGYMFPMLVVEQHELWPEKNLRQRVWVCIHVFLCHYIWRIIKASNVNNDNKIMLTC